MKLEYELLEPAVRSDVRRLDALIADDFVEVGAAGRPFGKAEVVDRLPGETGVAFRARAMQAHALAPSVVLVTYAAERSHQGHTTCSLRSSVWVKNAGGWQMRYHQGTTAA
ncbi:DUF4440 domain-containing protein [Lysobacter zhanggongensis]|uniref:nuclear transport factor 2 family protein n=1 Tax=Lysobacter zhanggongensis TaxID=1774951 RepID=UPI00399CC826